MTLALVTGFVPIEDHPRSQEEYQGLWEKLAPVADKLELPFYVAQYGIEDCWLYKYLEWGKLEPNHSVADNPKKNTLAYHIVQHEKLMMLVRAAHSDIGEKTDVFAWVDMGIHSVPGVTNDIILETIKRADNEGAITIPGCWEHYDKRADPINDSQVNWRFCGGFMVVPKTLLMEFELAFRADVMRHIREKNNVSWEVNTLARLERYCSLPIWHYMADHNETMFTNYPRNAGRSLN